MRTVLKIAFVTGLAAAGSGCLSEEFRRADGLTDGAGNAQASNTVMQMVDPWQNGVQETKLRVPAGRGSPGAAAGAATAPSSPTTSTTSN